MIKSSLCVMQLHKLYKKPCLKPEWLMLIHDDSHTLVEIYGMELTRQSTKSLTCQRLSACMTRISLFFS